MRQNKPYHKEDERLSNHLKKKHRSIVIDVKHSWLIDLEGNITCPYCDEIIFKLSPKTKGVKK